MDVLLIYSLYILIVTIHVWSQPLKTYRSTGVWLLDHQKAKGKRLILVQPWLNPQDVVQNQKTLQQFGFKHNFFWVLGYIQYIYIYVHRHHISLYDDYMLSCSYNWSKHLCISPHWSGIEADRYAKIWAEARALGPSSQGVRRCWPSPSTEKRSCTCHRKPGSG